jgi:hypothetical protein
MNKIGYLSEDDKTYCRLVGLQKTLAKLRTFVRSYEPIASDALAIVDAMTEEDFAVWRAGIALERKGEFAGEAFAIKYGPVMMPTVIVRIGLIAVQYHAPFGVAYIRAREFGLVVEDDRGIAHIQEPA